MEGWVDVGSLIVARPGIERPLDRKSDALTVTPPSHLIPEGITASSMFSLGGSTHSTTASCRQPSGRGTTCLLVMSCLLPLRRSFLDWQALRWHNRQFRNIVFLSAHICAVVVITDSDYRLSPAFKHSDHARRYPHWYPLCSIGRDRDRERERER